MQQDLFRMDLADNRRQPVVASLPARLSAALRKRARLSSRFDVRKRSAAPLVHWATLPCAELLALLAASGAAALARCDAEQCAEERL
jgi:hypothetical protein